MPAWCRFAPVLALFAAHAWSDTGPEGLQARLDTLSAGEAPGVARLIDPDAVRDFYAARSFRPAWQGEACGERLGELSAVIEASEGHGLDPDFYHFGELSSHVDCGLDTELLATDAWLSLAAHLHGGRVDPVTVEPDWIAKRPGIDFASRLAAAVDSGEVGETLLELAPGQPSYRVLRQALARFRRYAKQGGWSGVDEGPRLRLGDTGPRVSQLRARLARSGLLDHSLAELAEPFDEALETAVKTFQLRANLEPDGVVGPMTLRQLNLAPEDRIAQLRVNLERWRWLPDDLGERHIRVNIADFRLEARSAGAVEREHKVIVGKQHRRTPIFSGEISYVVLNPWWETPRRLAVQDKLPLFSSDPSAIERLGFEIRDAGGQQVDPASIDWTTVTAKTFPYRIRQAPGPMNALGQVKLIFPNPHAVYLHDTPTRGLFARVRRDFSSGCIRVEDALGLTEWVLKGNPAWDRERIDAVVASREETRVDVPERVPVHLLYMTVVPHEGDRVRFIDDLYDHDTVVLAALDGSL